MPAGGSGVVELRSVWRTFRCPGGDIVAVRDLDLRVEAGTFVALLGPSGSGKSTVLNLIAGLDEPTSGHVRVLDESMDRLDEAGRARLRLTSVGVVYQDDHLIDELTVADNIGLPLAARRVPPGERGLVVDGVLDRVGLGGFGARYPDELSGGQRQRVGIARAVVGGRAVLLADEPTGSLDSSASAVVFDLIAMMVAAGTTAIVVSHDPLVTDYADVVIRMVDGRAA